MRNGSSRYEEVGVVAVVEEWEEEEDEDEDLKLHVPSLWKVASGYL